MPRFKITRTINHKAIDIYRLIEDVEQYPQFVPMCKALIIRSEREDNEQKMMLTDMTVGYKAVSETFSTRVLLDTKALSINVSNFEGPFHHLDIKWKITEIGEASSQVSFSADYEFKNRFLRAIMGSMFDRIFNKFVDAFERRADSLYG